MEIAAGEYGYDVGYFRRMLNAGAVDVIQADITRCGGVTGLAAGRSARLCAPHRPLRALRAVLSSARRLRRAALPASRMVSRSCAHRADAVRWRAARKDGAIAPDLSRPGMGLEFKEKDAEKFAL